MKREFIEEHNYHDERRVLNSARHRRKVRDRLATHRAAKRGERQIFMKEIESETEDST